MSGLRVRAPVSSSQTRQMMNTAGQEMSLSAGMHFPDPAYHAVPSLPIEKITLHFKPPYVPTTEPTFSTERNISHPTHLHPWPITRRIGTTPLNPAKPAYLLHKTPLTHPHVTLPLPHSPTRPILVANQYPTLPMHPQPTPPIPPSLPAPIPPPPWLVTPPPPPCLFVSRLYRLCLEFTLL